MKNKTIQAWHRFVETRDPAVLESVLAETVPFHSPVVHTPQEGRAITMMYLQAAVDVLCKGNFRYVREIVNEQDAALEFVAEIKGIIVNGVDIISWDKNGKITDFKVMIRPLKGIQIIHQEMAARLGV